MGRFSRPLSMPLADAADVTPGQDAPDVGCGPGALAQLVVHFLRDPVAGLAEMARVTRPQGLVAACVWDHGGGRGPLTAFWRAVHDLDPTSRGEGELPGTHRGRLGALAREAGMREVSETALTTSMRCASFEDWWAPFQLGVGLAGAYVAALDEAGRAALRGRCAAVLPPAPFTVEATAWCVTARPWSTGCGRAPRGVRRAP